MFLVKEKSRINSHNDCELIPLNFEDKVKHCGVHLMECWLMNDKIKPYNPLKPNLGLKKIKFKPMSSQIQELTSTIFTEDEY